MASRVPTRSIPMSLFSRVKLAKLIVHQVRRLMKTREIDERDFLQYFQKAIRYFLYASRHRAVITRRLIKRKMAVITMYNIMDYKLRSKVKVKQRKKKDVELALSWSQRVVLYLKRQRALAKICNEPQSKLEPDDIKKLNERINKYKSDAAKLTDTGVTVSINGFAKVTCGADKLPVEGASSAKYVDHRLPEQSTDARENKVVESSKTAMLKGTKFLDSLIKKLKNDYSTTSDHHAPEIRKLSLVQKLAINSKKGEDRFALKYDSESSNSSDFCGFNDIDASSGLLPTPMVPLHKQSEKSAFVSEKLDAFLRENSLENKAVIELPKYRRIEEGMVCEGAQPPKINMQRVPDEFSRARTVAEKRILLEKKKNVKYFIIENENTIYRELKRRSKSGQANGSLVTNIQNTDVPFTRDCWKATSWLRTSNGKYCFQILKVDGKEYKMIGTRGNHCQKILGIQNNSPMKRRYMERCPVGCKQRIDLKNLKLNLHSLMTSQLDSANDIPNKKPKHLKLLDFLKCKRTYKPGPLSKKRLKCEKVENGDVKIFQMPTMQLEVFPEVNQPLDEKIKPYLRLICPSQKISREWAEFAVSTVVTKPSKQNRSAKKSFTFDIPYANHQKTILVRQVLKRDETYDPNIHKTDFIFRKNLKTGDALAVACADVLSEMIDSVAVGLCEDSLIANDPCIDYSRNKISDICMGREMESTPQPESERSSKPGASKKTANKLLKELKRLNATIVKAEGSCIPDIAKCDKDFCKLGCVCHSLNGSSIAKSHCMKVNCMFTCTCKNVTRRLEENDPNCLLSKEDAMVICEQATARLAKEEKEFSATVLLSGNTTYLLNESQRDKRRTKRLPKRFSDFVHEDVLGNSRESEPEVAPLKSSTMDSSSISPEPFNHCNVRLRKLENIGDIESWCMVHCLYKCFCRGNAVEGEPFKFEQGEISDTEEILYSRKRRYSFDRQEPEVPSTTSIKRKYYSAGYVSGSRTSEIPSHIYISINREKAASLKAMVTAEETSEKKDLLRTRILQSRNPKSYQVLKVVEANRSVATKDHVYPPSEQSSKSSSCAASSTKSVPAKLVEVTGTSEHNAESNSSNNKSENKGHASKMPHMSSFLPSDVGLSDNGKISIDLFHKKTLGMLNMAVTKTMQSICHIQNQNLKQIPNPVPGTLCSAQWKYFLQAFNENRIYVWEVCVSNQNILVATKYNTMPQVSGAMCAANIRILSRNKLPLIATMLLDGLTSDNMKTMSVLMAGQSSYWQIIGCTRSEQEYSNMRCIVKPTPQTHPNVSTKVNELYKLIFLRGMENLRNKALVDKKRSISPLQSKLVSSTNTSIDRLELLQASRAVPNKNKGSTNLEFKPVRKKDSESIIVPIPHEKDHLWLMIDFEDDFSHIYVPEWKDFLTYERIKKSFVVAQKSGKTVRLGQLKGTAHIYATPHNLRRMYIGPFFEPTKVNMILCQNMDGKIISREDYEKSQNVKHLKNTVAYWLPIRNSTLIFDQPKVVESNTSQSGKIVTGASTARNVDTSLQKFKQVSAIRKVGQMAQIIPRKNAAKPSKSKNSLLKSSVGSLVLLKEKLKKEPSSASALNQLMLSKKAIPSSTISSVTNASPMKSFPPLPARKSPKETLPSTTSPESSTSSANQLNKKQIKKVFYLKANKTPESKSTPDSDGNKAAAGSTPRECLEKETNMDQNAKNMAMHRFSMQFQQRRSSYFISDDVSLGKVLSHKTSDKYFIKMRDKLDWMPFPDEVAVDRFLKNVVKEFTRGVYNNTMRWRYVPFGAKEQKYPLFSLENLKVCCSKSMSLLKRPTPCVATNPNPINAEVMTKPNILADVPVLPSAITVIPTFKNMSPEKDTVVPCISMKSSSVPSKHAAMLQVKGSAKSRGRQPTANEGPMPVEVILIDD